VEKSHRVLVIMRHAKAQQFGPSDHERELEPRGVRDATEAGSWLARNEVDVDHALVSSAARSVGTWEAVADAADWDLEPDIDSSLYDGGPETTLDVIRSLPEEVTSAILIGHNPAIASLAQLLDDGDGDEESISEMTQGYPTGALAIFEYDGEWVDLDVGTARVTAFHVPGG